MTSPEKASSVTSLPHSIPNDESSKRTSVADESGKDGVELTESHLEAESTEKVETNEGSNDVVLQQNKAPSYIDHHEIDYQEQQEKRKRALEQQLLDKSKVPASYYTLSKKEEMILKYVENFNRQYVQLYPGRKELFLCPANEFGIKKFVCTTVRPTQLPFKELYDYRSCAKFISDYLTGFGYDAYVVSGYATRDITVMDETRTDSDAVGIKSPYSSAPEANEKDKHHLSSESGKGGVVKYKEERKRQQELKEVEQRRLELERQRALLNEDDDELKGLRIHAWVLVLPGKREIAEAFFIEPSTGKIYPTDNDNYLGVESGIQFDLGDNSKWEFVLLENVQPGNPSKTSDNLAENDNSSEDEDEDEKTSEILDLPPSWVDKIVISKEQYESRCPLGSKVITYKNARHEIFADYHRTDGMVSRLTFFADDIKGFFGEIREKFRNRRDKLVERVRVPHLGKVQEYFDPGRPHGLKEHVMVDEEKDAHKGDEEESKITNLDYLSPFLVNYPNHNSLTRDEALAVKEACLKSLKERLIEKANIIQGRLEEVTAEYQRRQLAYSRNADSMTVEETDEYVRFCNDALFKIHILEKRLAKHKENAPEKFIELDMKLKGDHRLHTAFQAK
ncbi:hypothetical protein HDU96_009564 [Phlyctochytrium bullatum]|nr:hypothetical protein HDU96_009564 [Phlyctochytrium bullatum]